MNIITNYSTLQAAVAEYLVRSDLTTTIKALIDLAEADIRRNLRDRKTLSAVTLDSDAVAFPAGVSQILSLRFDTDTRKYPLKKTTPANLATLRRSGSGVPHYYAVVGTTILLDITPDTSYACEAEVFEGLVSLSDADPTNYTLTTSPDIYLFGTLKEAEPYLEHDERNPMWSAKYQKAVDDENRAREEAELAGGPVVMRLPITFG